MKQGLVVVEGFYDNPDEVRAAALSMEFSVYGNYPGVRTKAWRSDGIRSAIQRYVDRPIVDWELDYNGAFQCVTAGAHTWIHADQTTSWAGVLYLTQNAPTSCGTSFYRHWATGAEHFPVEPDKQEIVLRDGANRGAWECIDRVANLYNRLVLYDARRFHVADGYFGSGLHDGRLTQVFFFNTGW